MSLKAKKSVFIFFNVRGWVVEPFPFCNDQTYNIGPHVDANKMDFIP